MACMKTHNDGGSEAFGDYIGNILILFVCSLTCFHKLPCENTWRFGMEINSFCFTLAQQRDIHMEAPLRVCSVKLLVMNYLWGQTGDLNQAQKQVVLAHNQLMHVVYESIKQHAVAREFWYSALKGYLLSIIEYRTAHICSTLLN